VLDLKSVKNTESLLD